MTRVGTLSLTERALLTAKVIAPLAGAAVGAAATARCAEVGMDVAVDVPTAVTVTSTRPRSVAILRVELRRCVISADPIPKCMAACLLGSVGPGPRSRRQIGGSLISLSPRRH